MKKVFFVVICCLICFFLSCNNEAEPEKAEFKRFTEKTYADTFFFYIPGDDEVADFLSFASGLTDVEEGTLDWEKELLYREIDDLYGKNSLHSLELEAFLIGTSNRDLQKEALEYLKQKGTDDSFVKSLERKYESKKNNVSGPKEGITKIQFNYRDLYYGEDLYLYNPSEAVIFNGRLRILMLQNEWEMVAFPEKESAGFGEDGFYCLAGGATNSLYVSFKEYTEISEDVFLKEIENEYYKEKYGNWTQEELSIEGVFERANADRIFIAVGSGPEKMGDEVISEIDTAVFKTSFYNSQFKRGYQITYYMNYSKLNLSYFSRNRQLNLLAFLSLFATIVE